jgi:hypothetical protein
MNLRRLHLVEGGRAGEADVSETMDQRTPEGRPQGNLLRTRLRDAQLATSTSINVLLEQPCFCDGARIVGLK